MSENDNEAEPSANEKWYDAEIAPALLELSRKCGERGMAFIAVVEYDPKSRGRTSFIPEPQSLEMVMINHCAKMGNNIDGYLMGLMRHCDKNKIDYSNSIFLHRYAKAPTDA